MKKKTISVPGAPRLDPKEAGTGPSPKLVLSVPSVLKDRLVAIAEKREDALSVVVREALEEKAAKEERRLGI